MLFIPYTYCLYHIPTGKKYYGYQGANNKRQVANPINLWATYFSSSKKIKNLIKQYGKESFTYEVRKIFETAEEAFNWEQKVLRKINAVEREDWLNEGYANPKFNTLGKHHSEETKQKIGKSNSGRYLGKPLSEKHKENLRKAWLTRIPTKEHIINSANGHRGMKYKPRHPKTEKCI